MQNIAKLKIILFDKERLGSNLEALASSFKPNSPKQAHHEALASCVLDFDDILCIHTDHTSGGDEEYNAKMVVWDMSVWKNCQVNEQLALFMNICEEKGIRMGLISTTESFRHMEARQQFVKRMYGVNLENFCVGTQDGKLNMLNAIAAAYVYEKDEIAIVDDYWYQLERAADAGFQAYSPMQIVNYVNSYMHKKEIK